MGLLARGVAPQFYQPLGGCRSFSSFPDYTPMPMPALSPTMETGNIAVWHVKEGDEITAGTVLCEVETDKATVDFVSQDDGFVAKILVPEGAKDIPVNAPLAVVVEEQEDVAAFASFSLGDIEGAAPAAAPAAEPTPAAAPAVSAPVASAPVATSAAPTGARVFASPLARRLAREQGLDVNAMKGTGPRGRVIKVDVAEFAATAAAAPPAEATASAPVVAAASSEPLSAVLQLGGGVYRDVLLSETQLSLAERLAEARKEIPHYHLTVDVEVDALQALRLQLNAGLGKDDAPISLHHMLLKASAVAMRSVPDLNSSWIGTAIRQYQYVDLSVVVSVDEEEEGYTVSAQPVLRDAHSKGLKELAADSELMVSRVRSGELTTEDSLGGTFAVCNLGALGVKQFSGVITPPQAGLLSLGAAERVVLPSAQGEELPYKVATVLTATLTCDHRVVDGAVGAAWLAAYKKLVEDPMTMLL